MCESAYRSKIAAGPVRQARGGQPLPQEESAELDVGGVVCENTPTWKLVVTSGVLIVVAMLGAYIGVHVLWRVACGIRALLSF